MSSHPNDLVILLQPGIGNSGPAHWQSLWEASEADCIRVRQRDWDHPTCSEWVQAIGRVVEEIGRDCVLVAHSLGCLATAHWAAGEVAPNRRHVRGLMLVAPPDPKGPEFPAEATGFASVPHGRLLLPTLVVASDNDPFAPMEFSRRIAATWGARLVSIGAAGHINAASGLGAWPQGQTLLRELVTVSSIPTT